MCDVHWCPLSTDKESNRQGHLGRWKRYYHLKRVFYLVYFRKVSLGYMRENYARLDEVLTECYLIGKWENGVYKFLWEIFVATHKKKASKVVNDSRGNFLFIPELSFFILSGEVLVDPAWESWGSCGSRPLLHLPLLDLPILDLPPLLDPPLLDLLLLDLLHKQVWFLYFTFHWHFKILKREGSIFCLWVFSVAFLSILHEIKCFLHRFIKPEDLLTCHPCMCTSQETLPGHLSFLDLAVSLW